MDLKEVLGEELYNQVKEKIGDKELLINDGSFIPKERFNQVNENMKDYKKQLEDRDKQLKDLEVKAQGNEDLLKQLNDLQVLNKTTKDEYETKLQKQQFDFSLEKALAKAEAKNIKAVKALLEVDKVKLDGDQFIGLEEQLKALKESEPYLFGKDTISGKKPNMIGNTPIGNNPWSKEHFNLTKQGEILLKDPELAQRLMTAK